TTRRSLPPPRARHVVAGLAAVGSILVLVVASVVSHRPVGTIATAGEGTRDSSPSRVLALEVVAPSLPAKSVESPVPAAPLDLATPPFSPTPRVRVVTRVVRVPVPRPVSSRPAPNGTAPTPGS